MTGKGLMATFFVCLIVSSAALAGSIHTAAKQGDLEGIKMALKEDPALINQLDEAQNQPIHLACQEGHLKVVKFLLARGADLEAGDREGTTPVQVAALFGHPKIVKYLLSKGAQVNAADQNGMTALLFAAYHGHTEIVELLTKHEAEK